MIRNVIKTLKPFTRIHLKVVEKAGRKIIDTLHKCNPWENSICEREDCLPCRSSKKEAVKSCKRRSIVYQTWCHTCRQETWKEIEKKNDSGPVIEGNDMNTPD